MQVQCCAEQISVQLFSLLRQLLTWHCPHLLLRAVLRLRAAAAPAVQQAIDISYLPGPQQQTRRTMLQRANGTDRQTDRRTAYRFIDAARYSVRVERVKRLTERYSRRHDDTDQHQTAEQQITNQPTAVTPRWTLFH